MKTASRHLAAVFLGAFSLSGCIAGEAMWRDGAEKNCAQESMASRRDSCMAWVDQKAWEMSLKRRRDRD